MDITFYFKETKGITHATMHYDTTSNMSTDNFNIISSEIKKLKEEGGKLEILDNNKNVVLVVDLKDLISMECKQFNLKTFF